MLKKIEAALIWGQLLFCCVLVISLIGVSKVYSDKETDNKVVRFLLKQVSIQTVVADDQWKNKYPFVVDEGFETHNGDAVERYVSKINAVKNAIDNYCTTSFPGNGTISRLVSTYKDKVLQYRISSIPGIENNRAYITDAAENVIELNGTVNSLGIPFVYVQTPLKVGIDYYNNVEIVGDELNTAERSYCITSMLEERGVDVINIARDHSAGITFDNSEHWKPSDGLNCAKLIAEKLNDYGLAIDEAMLEKDKFYDLLSIYPNEKETLENNTDYEFAVLSPTYETSFELTYAEESFWSGTFENVIFRDSSEWNLEGGPYHNVYRISNSLINEIYNKNAPCDKEILIIGDSSNWPVAAYLSLGCRKVTAIHNASFTGSLVSYIKAWEPDAVIMVYNDAEFYDIYTKDAYHLK